MRFLGTTALSLVAILFLTAAAQAGVLYEDGFDYGDTTGLVKNGFAGNWSTTSGVLYYDHDGGLTHAGLEAEAGGAFYHDFTSGNRSITNSVDPVFDPFPGMGAGDALWFAGLIQLANDSGTTNIQFSNGEGVNAIGFGVDADGDVIVTASLADAGAADHDTGVDAADDGSTYLFLVRGTLGSGPDTDKASRIDFWFNPADTSSEGALDTPDWTTGDANSKWGRSTGSYNSAVINASYQSRADGLRVGDTLNDVVNLPEPATLGLLALGGAGFMAVRRSRR